MRAPGPPRHACRFNKKGEGRLAAGFEDSDGG